MRILLITVFLGLVTFTAGCDEEQLKSFDKIVTDANEIVTTGQGVLQSPAGALLPPDLRLYGTIAIALASIGVNSWQKVRAVLMTKTTKAIVKGIENADEDVLKKAGNPLRSSVKQEIRNEMQAAGIYDKGNKIIDQLKIAR